MDYATRQTAEAVDKYVPKGISSSVIAQHTRRFPINRKLKEKIKIERLWSKYRKQQTLTTEQSAIES